MQMFRPAVVPLAQLAARRDGGKRCYARRGRALALQRQEDCGRWEAFGSRRRPEETLLSHPAKMIKRENQHPPPTAFPSAPVKPPLGFILNLD